MENKIISFIFLILWIPNHSFSQSDSLDIYFVSAGFKGEKYKIYIPENSPHEFKTSISFKYYFKMKADNWGQKEQVRIQIYRKGRFGLIYRSTDFSFKYDRSKKYLVIKREPRLKKKFAISCYWSNEEPKFLYHTKKGYISPD